MKHYKNIISVILLCSFTTVWSSNKITKIDKDTADSAVHKSALDSSSINKYSFGVQLGAGLTGLTLGYSSDSKFSYKVGLLLINSGTKQDSSQLRLLGFRSEYSIYKMAKSELLSYAGLQLTSGLYSDKNEVDFGVGFSIVVEPSLIPVEVNVDFGYGTYSTPSRGPQLGLGISYAF